MTVVEQMAEFAVRADVTSLSRSALLQLKIRVLDALGCALGAFDGDPVRRVRQFVVDFSHDGCCTLIGGGRSAPDRAALYNGALVRYLDFNDSYLAPHETCHPSDNLGAVLAAAELANADGATLLTALAVAYQVQCRLSDAAPVRDRGFDHTTHLAYSVAAGVSRALSLDAPHTANAIAISGTALNALRVTRTGTLSHWKGLAAPFAASAATQATLLAQRGITGPAELFEGNKGFVQSIAGPFAIDWRREGLDRVERTIIKRYNAEIHSQTAIEAALQLQRQYGFDASDVETVEVDVFDVAHRIIGGGEEGDKTLVFTKEDADHSLPYLIAVALLDHTVMPAQFGLERLHARGCADAPLPRRRASTHRVHSPLSGGDAFSSDSDADGRTGLHARTHRLPWLPHATTDMGGRGGKVQDARRIARRRYGAHRDRERGARPRTHHRRRADTIARHLGTPAQSGALDAA